MNLCYAWKNGWYNYIFLADKSTEFISSPSNNIFYTNRQHKKSKHRYKKGTIIAHQHTFFERLKQDYIKNYITFFRKEYKFYMVLKKSCIIWTFLFPCVLVLLELFTSYSSLVAKIGMYTSIILAIFSALHFNTMQKTKYEL